MHGYRAMLRDRMLDTTSLALKLYGCKGAYVDYVYDRYVAKAQKKDRSIVVKKVLGLIKMYTYEDIRLVMWEHGIIVKEIDCHKIPDNMLYMTFHESIDWNTLQKEDKQLYEDFKAAGEWVKWFTYNLKYVQNDWDWHIKNCTSESDFIAKVAKKYSLRNDTIKFLIKYFKNGKQIISNERRCIFVPARL